MCRECGKRFLRYRLQRKPLVSDPGLHHGKCVTHVPWSMSGSLARGGGENVSGIPGACATRNFTYLTRGPHNLMIKNIWLCMIRLYQRITKIHIIHLLNTRVPIWQELLNLIYYSPVSFFPSQSSLKYTNNISTVIFIAIYEEYCDPYITLFIDIIMWGNKRSHVLLI